MIVQLTDAGAALLNANTGPITLTAFKLGSAFGYIPAPTDTDIHGTLIYTGAPSPYVAVNANVIKYSAYLDYNLGPFDFGEIGFYTSTNVLFALGANDQLIHKIAAGVGTGNSIRLDIYLSAVGQNYEMWLDYGESSNGFQMAVLGSVDQLPQPQNARPNAYVISGKSNTQSSFMAYTDREGLWSFDAYEFANQASGTVSAFDFQSVTIPATQFVPNMDPNYLGEVVLEFTSGSLYGTCRYVSSAIPSGGNVTLGFDNPVMVEPIVGDTFVTYKRIPPSTNNAIPIATHSVLGGVIVGTSLTVDSTGLINVNPTDFPVTSVNTKTGAVVLTASDITGFAAVATSGNYNDLTNKPAAYTLPVANLSVLGGVKAPSSGNLTISASGVIDIGFTTVSSVNGKTGVVNLVPGDIPGFAAVATSGDYNDLINKPTIPAPYTLPVATTTVLGGVKQGSGVTIAGDGTISAAGTYVLPTASPTVLGGIKVGTGLSIDGAGVLSSTSTYVLPTASASVLGGIKVGAGLAIDGSGILSVTASGVTSLNALSGNVTLVAGTNVTVTPVSNTLVIASTIPVASTTVLGGVKQGTNITIAGDGTISATAAPYTLPVATTTVLGGVKQGSGVTIAGDGTLSVTATGGVTTFNTRSGAVTLTSADVSSASGALLSDVAAAKYYDIVGGAAGAILSSQILAQYVSVRTITLGINFLNSKGFISTAPTSTFNCVVAVNGTTVGNVIFASGSQTSTFTTVGGTTVTVTPGQVVTITAPAVADATAANVSITLLGVAT